MGEQAPHYRQDKPRLEITEQPKSTGFRFRYKSEGPSHGGLSGVNSTKNHETYPSVKIVNYTGRAKVVAQLVTDKGVIKLHPHSLVGRQCQNGICTLSCGPHDMTASFRNLGILHATKKDVPSILEKRYLASEEQINCGFRSDQGTSIEENRKKAENEAKLIDLSVVRLMFIAYLQDSNGDFTVKLEPAISDPIFDSKNSLKICRISSNSGKAAGKEEIFLLCDKVKRGDIEIHFIEEDDHGEVLWTEKGEFFLTDVHRQFAIVFKTPPYENQEIAQPVNVKIQLCRRSDGEVSDAVPFKYLPNLSDVDETATKKRKVSYADHLPKDSKGARKGTSLQRSKKQQTSCQTNQKCSQRSPLDPSFLLSQYTTAQAVSCFLNPGIRPHQDISLRKPLRQQPSGSQLQVQQRNQHERTVVTGQRTFLQPQPMRTQGPFIQQRQQQPVITTQGASQQQQPVITTQGASQQQQPVITTQGASQQLQPVITFQGTSQQQPVITMQGTSQQQRQLVSTMQDASLQQQLVSTTQDAFLQQQLVSTTQDAFLQQQLVSTMQGVSLQQQPVTTLEGTGDQHRCFAEPSSSQLPAQPLVMQMDCNASSAQSNTLQNGYPQSFTSSMQNGQPPQMENVLSHQDLQQQSNTLQLQLSASCQQPGSSLPPQSTTQSRSLNHAAQPWYNTGTNVMQTFDGYSGFLTPAVPQSSLNGSFEDEAAPVVNPDIYLSNLSTTNAATAPIGNLGNDNSSFDISDLFDQSLSTDIQFDQQMLQTNHLECEEPDFASGFEVDADVDAAPLGAGLQVDPPADADGDIEFDCCMPMELLSLQEQVKRNDEQVKRNETANKEVEVSMRDVVSADDASMLTPNQADAVRTLIGQAMEVGDDTLLHEAVIYDQMDLTALLNVIKTFNNFTEILNSQNRKQQTALQITTLMDNISAVQMLLRAGACPLVVDRNGNHSIHVACRHGNADILEKILSSLSLTERGYDTTNNRGLGCYHLAAKAKSDSRQCMRMLKRHHFDVDMQDESSGRTALHVTAKYNSLELALCLIAECDADIEAMTYDGYTPLHIAAATDSCEVASLLLACGADPEARSLTPDSEDEIGAKPIDFARSQKMQDILSGKISLSEDGSCEDLTSLNPSYQDQLCDLLNVDKICSNWFALVNCLQLTTSLVTILDNSNNPTDSLLRCYAAWNGSASRFRSALIDIGRHDALQVFNRAFH